MIQMCNLGNWFAMIIQNDCNNSDNLGNWFAMIIQNDCKNSDKLVSQPVHFFTQVTILHEISKCLEDFNEFAEDVRRFAPSGKMVVPPMKQEPKGAC